MRINLRTAFTLATLLLPGCGGIPIAGMAKVNPQFCRAADRAPKGTIDVKLDRQKLMSAKRIVFAFDITYKADTNITASSYTISFPGIGKTISGKTRANRRIKIELTPGEISMARRGNLITVRAEIAYPGDWCAGISLADVEYR